MKKSLKTIVSSLICVLMVSSCGLFKKNTAESVDYTNGRQVGTVLVKLANEYVSSGSLNLGNVQNILSIATLANSLGTLKSDSNLAHKEFDNGLMSVCSMVKKSNQTQVHDALTELTNLDLDSIVSRLQKNKVDAKTELLKDQLESVLSMLK